MRTRQRLGFPCPKCSREYGFIAVKRWSKKRPTHKEVKNIHGNVIETIPIRRIRKMKRMTSQPAEALDEVVMNLALWKDIWHIIMDKYPHLRKYEQHLVAGLYSFGDVVLPWTDNKYHVDRYGWFAIMEDVRNYGYYKASKIHRISINQIKAQMTKMEQFNIDLVKNTFNFFESIKLIQDVIDNDLALKEYVKWLQEYYHENKDLILDDSGQYEYNDYRIIHSLNPDPYKYGKINYENKRSRKNPLRTRPRRIECGPFKRWELPVYAFSRKKPRKLTCPSCFEFGLSIKEVVEKTRSYYMQHENKRRCYLTRENLSGVAVIGDDITIIDKSYLSYYQPTINLIVRQAISKTEDHEVKYTAILAHSYLMYMGFSEEAAQDKVKADVKKLLGWKFSSKRDELQSMYNLDYHI